MALKDTGRAFSIQVSTWKEHGCSSQTRNPWKEHGCSSQTTSLCAPQQGGTPPPPALECQTQGRLRLDLLVQVVGQVDVDLQQRMCRPQVATKMSPTASHSTGTSPYQPKATRSALPSSVNVPITASGKNDPATGPLEAKGVLELSGQHLSVTSSILCLRVAEILNGFLASRKGACAARLYPSGCAVLNFLMYSAISLALFTLSFGHSATKTAGRVDQSIINICEVQGGKKLCFQLRRHTLEIKASSFPLLLLLPSI